MMYKILCIMMFWLFAVSASSDTLYVPVNTLVYVIAVDNATGILSLTDSIGMPPSAVATLGIEANKERNKAYVSSWNSGLGIIDLNTYNTSSVYTGTADYGMDISPDSSKLYLCTNKPSIKILDTSADTFTNEIDMPESGNCIDVKFTPDGTKAYTTIEDAPTMYCVAVINTASETVDTYIDLDLPRGMGIAIHPDGTKAYISHFKETGASISMIDLTTNTVIDTVTTLDNNSALMGIGISPSGDLLYVEDLSDVAAIPFDIDENGMLTPQAEIPLGGTAGGSYTRGEGIVFSSDGSMVYMVSDRVYKVFSIDAYGYSIIDALDIPDAHDGPRSIALVESDGVGVASYELHPRGPILLQSCPMPFNSSTEIRFSLPFAGFSSLKIYNVTGQLIKTLLDESMSEGPHKIFWDAKDEHRKHVAAGIYFCRLESGEFTATKKIIKLK